MEVDRECRAAKGASLPFGEVQEVKCTVGCTYRCVEADMAATERLEVRLTAADKAYVEDAAALEGAQVSPYVRESVLESAKRTHERFRSEAVTTVPADFLADLLESLDAPLRPNRQLQQAAARAREMAVNVESTVA